LEQTDIQRRRNLSIAPPFLFSGVVLGHEVRCADAAARHFPQGPVRGHRELIKGSPRARQEFIKGLQANARLVQGFA